MKKGTKKYKHLFVVLGIMFLGMAVLMGCFINSKWYRELQALYKYDAVAFAKYIKQEKLDEKVIGIDSAFVFDTYDNKIELELPVEFWTMICNDFMKMSWKDKISYRIEWPFEPVDDVMDRYGGRKLIEFELVLTGYDEPVVVKIYTRGGLQRGGGPKYNVGVSNTKRYYKDALKFICEE